MHKKLIYLVCLDGEGQLELLFYYSEQPSIQEVFNTLKRYRRTLDKPTNLDRKDDLRVVDFLLPLLAAGSTERHEIGKSEYYIYHKTYGDIGSVSAIELEN